MTSSPDWIVLESSVTSDSLQDDLLKKGRFRGNNTKALKSKKYWETPGTDSLGVNLLPAGAGVKDNPFWGLGELAFFWTATPYVWGGIVKPLAMYRYLDNDSVGVRGSFG